MGEHDKTRLSHSLWSNRNFLLLWSGQTISVLGTNVSRLALPLLVLALTHSPVQAGLLTATRQIPYLLFSLPAGALVDRWNRKAMMVGCDVVRWLVLGSIPLAYLLGYLTFVQLYIAAFIEGTAYVFFSLAQISALPQVVSEAHLSQAYAMDVTTEYVGELAGPSLGAFIIGLAPVVALGAIFAYLADSISYLVSVISLLFMCISFQVKHIQESKQRLYQDIMQGLRFLWKEPRLRAMVLLTTVINFLQSPVTLAIIVLAQGSLHSDVHTIGFILSAGGVGGVCGGLIAPVLRKRLRFGHIVIGSVAVWAVAALILALATSPLPLIIGSFLTTVIWPVYGVTLVTYRLSITPNELQGRVNSAFRFMSYGSEPLGAAIGGLLLLPLGARGVFALIVAGLVLSVIAASLAGLHKV